MTEEIFQNLTKERSVHLANWPEINVKPNIKLIQNMSDARDLVEVVHAARKSEGLPVRQPLQSIKVSVPFAKLPKGIEEIIKEEVNIIDVFWKKGKEIEVELNKEITPRLEVEAKTRDLIRRIQQERKNLGVGLWQKVIVTSDWLPDDSKLIKRVKTNTLTEKLTQGKFKVEKI